MVFRQCWFSLKCINFLLHSSVCVCVWVNTLESQFLRCIDGRTSAMMILMFWSLGWNNIYLRVCALTFATNSLRGVCVLSLQQNCITFLSSDILWGPFGADIARKTNWIWKVLSCTQNCVFLCNRKNTCTHGLFC